jgi:hypothetical protein
LGDRNVLLAETIGGELGVGSEADAKPAAQAISRRPVRERDNAGEPEPLVAREPLTRERLPVALLPIVAMPAIDNGGSGTRVILAGVAVVPVRCLELPCPASEISSVRGGRSGQNEFLRLVVTPVLALDGQALSSGRVKDQITQMESATMRSDQNG